MPGSVIGAEVRTPIGKLSGSLARFSAMELGGVAIGAAIERAGLSPQNVDHVLMGHVLQAGQGQMTARQAAVNAGIPMTVPATTVGKECLSGLHAIYLADLMVNAGEAEVVVAGGMESMTKAPHLPPGARAVLRLGDGCLIDSLTLGLTCAFEHVSMDLATDRYAQALGMGRAHQDSFAALSRERAAAAAKDGRFDEEIAPVSVPHRTGGPLLVESDEGIRAATTADTLRRLPPVFTHRGSITAGNSSQISDGGAAVVVTSRAKAQELGAEPLVAIVAYGQVAGPDPNLLHQPSRAIATALSKVGLEPADIDLFEINEAFAAVVLASADDLSIPVEKLNVNGGAIALGHPVGMSGTRVALTALCELRRRDSPVALLTLSSVFRLVGFSGHP